MAITDWLSSFNWATFLVFLGIFYLTYQYYKRRNLPPGPLSLPLLGSVGFYKEMSGQPPHVALAKAAKKYGSVFCVWVGPSPMIILDGYEAIYQTYVTQGSDFIDRPNWIGIVKQSLQDGYGVSWSNGEEWQVMRKFCLRSMRDFGGKASEIEQKILHEIEIMLQTIRETNGALFDISHILQMAVSNVISIIVFGQRFEYDDQNLHDLLRGLDLVVKGSGFLCPLNFLPQFMHPLFPEEYKNELERNGVVGRTRKLVSGTYERHESTFDPEHIRDFMDVYIQSQREDMTKTRNKYFHKGNMWRVIYDLFLAGSETTSTSLEWAFLHLVERPEIQRKCQHTIAECVGDRPVHVADRPNMPYIDAVLNEVLRLSCVIPIGVPRTTQQDILVMGYKIPKHSIVMANVYSAHVDPKYWPDPFEFKPDRFLDGDGKLVRKESFIPFSVGPRNCLGDSLSRMEMFLMFTNLLQKFNFKRDEAALKHNLGINDEQYMTLRPVPYKLKAVPRTQ